MTETTAPKSARCPCDWLAGDRDHELAERIRVHDDLLSFEDLGLSGVIGLLEHVAMSADAACDDLVPLYPWDLEAFVAQHNWDQPADVARLADRVADEHELSRQRKRWQDSLTTIRTAVGWALERD